MKILRERRERRPTDEKDDHVNENLNQLWTTANKTLQLA